MATIEIKPEIKQKAKIFCKEGNMLIDATTCPYITRTVLRNICPFLKAQLERKDSESAKLYAKKPTKGDDYYVYYYKITYKDGRELEIGVKDDFLNLPVIEAHMVTFTGVEFKIWPIGTEIDKINNLLFNLEKSNKVKHLKVWLSNGKIIKYRVTFISGLIIQKVIEDIEKKEDVIIKAFEDGKPIPSYSFKAQKAYEILKKRYDWIKNMKELKLVLKGNKIIKYDVIFGENNSISVSCPDGITIYEIEKDKREKPIVETYLKIQDKEIKVCSISNEKEKKINMLLESLKDNVKKVKVYFEKDTLYKYELFDKEGELIKREESNNILPTQQKVQEKPKKVAKILIRIPKGYENYIKDFELIRREKSSLIGKIPIDKLNDKIMFLQY